MSSIVFIGILVLLLAAADFSGWFSRIEIFLNRLSLKSQAFFKWTKSFISLIWTNEFGDWVFKIWIYGFILSAIIMMGVVIVKGPVGISLNDDNSSFVINLLIYFYYAFGIFLLVNIYFVIAVYLLIYPATVILSWLVKAFHFMSKAPRGIVSRAALVLALAVFLGRFVFSQLIFI